MRLAACALLVSALRADPPSDRVMVFGAPISQRVFESALPSTVLEQPTLQVKSAPSLSETLADEPGVTSTFYGMVASRPVIRG